MSEDTSLEGDTPRGRRYRCQVSTNPEVMNQLGTPSGDGTDAAAWAQVANLFLVIHTPPAPWTVYDVAWREPDDTDWLGWWTILYVPSANRAWVHRARESFTDRSLERIAATIVDRHLDSLH